MCSKYAVRGLTYLSFSVIRVCHATHLNTVFRAIHNTCEDHQPGEDFLLSSKLDGSIPFLSEHLNMVCAPSCCQFWIWLMADQTLFNSMLKKQHCLYLSPSIILPEVKTSSLHLRQKGHMFDLPRCTTLEIHKRSFLPRCLFKFI